jgi:hypothetical protein
MEIDWTYLFEYLCAIGKQMLRPRRQEFFNAFFKKLAGSNELQEALESGMSARGVGEVLYRELYQYKQKAYAYAIYPQLLIETYNEPRASA